MSMINRSRERNRKRINADLQAPLQTRKIYWKADKDDAVLPAKRRQVNVRWISGILLVLLALSAFALATMPQFRVSKPTVSGSNLINLEEITYYTGLRSIPLFMVDPESIRQTLLKRYPEAKDVKVKAMFPNQVDITLEQRKPILEWDFGGSKFWVDDQGIVMKELTEPSEMMYVLANSFPGARNKFDRKVPESFTTHMLKTLKDIYAVKPEDGTLFYTYENGYGWMTKGEFTLWLGRDSNDLDEKLKMAESLANYFKEEEIFPEMLSLEFPGAPYYRFSE
jgi:cell division protein FtsQ